MKTSFSPLKLKKLFSSLSFGLVIFTVFGISALMGWKLWHSSDGDKYFKFFSALSFTISTITLLITSYNRKNELVLKTIHTFYTNVDGSGSVLIHNTSDQSLYISGIYFHSWPLHNSERKLLNIKSNESIEVSLDRYQMRTISPESELEIRTTICSFKSNYFERSNRFGSTEIEAKLIEQKKED